MQKGKPMDDLISRQALCEYALNQKDKSVTPNDIMRFPPAQPEKRTEERTETHGVCLDAIDRQATIDALEKVAELFPWRVPGNRDSYDHYNEGWNDAIGRAEIEIEKLPSAQPDTDMVSRQLMHNLGATCIARRDEDGDLVPIVGINLLPPAPEPTEQQATCEYCHEDAEGYVRPVEKNNHAFVRFGMNGWELSLKGNGWHGETPIYFCPMCGRKL